jgi:hypothetical protein
MQLHVLAGCHELLRPAILTPEEAASLIGPHVKTATASWLSPRYGSHYHTFLQDEPGDFRTKVMAAALRDEFGTRFEPLLLLPDLLDEIDLTKRATSPSEDTNRRSQATTLLEIWSYGHFDRLRIYSLAVPVKADPDGCWAVTTGIATGPVRDRMENLRNTIATSIATDAIETRTLEATPDLSVFATLYNNSLGNHFALQLAPRLRQHGLTSDLETMPNAIVSILVDWSKKGISPSLSLRSRELDAMATAIYEKLI